MCSLCSSYRTREPSHSNHVASVVIGLSAPPGRPISKVNNNLEHVALQIPPEEELGVPNAVAS